MWRYQQANVCRTKDNSSILSYSFDLQSCLHEYKRFIYRVCGKALENFVVKLSKIVEWY